MSDTKVHGTLKPVSVKLPIHTIEHLEALSNRTGLSKQAIQNYAILKVNEQEMCVELNALAKLPKAIRGVMSNAHKMEVYEIEGVMASLAEEIARR